MGPAICRNGGVPCRLALFRNSRIIQLYTVDFIGIQINNDIIIFGNQTNRPTNCRLWPDMADDKSDGPAGEPAIGHQADNDTALAAQGGNPRC